MSSTCLRFGVLPLVFGLLAAWAALPARGQEPSDPADRLEEGNWGPWLEAADALAARRQGSDLERARHLCEGCLRAADEDAARGAADRLVALHLAKDAPVASPHAAVRILMDLARKTGEDGVFERLEALRAEIIPRKAALWTRALDALNAGRSAEAEDALRPLLLQPFSLPSEVGDRVTDATILARLVEATTRIEEGIRARSAGREIHCQTCGGTHARTCPKCKGAGKVRRLQPATPDLPQGYYDERCTRCDGFGQLMCDACQCSGFSLDLLGERDAKALGAYARATVKLCNKTSLEDALEAAQDLVMDFRLQVPDAILPDDPDVAHLFPAAPNRSIPDTYKRAWKRRGLDRVSLLVDFGIVAARTFRPYWLHLDLDRTRAPKRDFSTDLAETVPLDPAVPGAFPGHFHDRWASVRVRYEGPAEVPGYRVARFFRFKGAGPSDLHFLLWDPPAENGARSAARLCPALRELSHFSSAYPFEEIQAFAEALQPGQEADLFGRLIVREDRWPRKIFEIWKGTAPGGPAGEEPKDGDVQPLHVGPLTEAESWVRRSNPPERLERLGNAHFRRGLDAARRASSGGGGFAAHNERAVLSLQKARAFYERAFFKEKSPAVAYLLVLVNLEILSRIEAARTR